MKPRIEEKIVFWLNMYNFLVIFSIIYKNEIPSSEYEFNKLLRNSFYNIGNYVISLNIIENIIIKKNYDRSKESDSFIDFEGNYLNTQTFLNTENNFIYFGISNPYKYKNI